jgi:hypothetical protein
MPEKILVDSFKAQSSKERNHVFRLLIRFCELSSPKMRSSLQHFDEYVGLCNILQSFISCFDGGHTVLPPPAISV